MFNQRYSEPPVRVSMADLKKVFGTKDEMYTFIVAQGGYLPGKDACDVSFLKAIMTGSKHVSLFP